MQVRYVTSCFDVSGVRKLTLPAIQLRTYRLGADDAAAFSAGLLSGYRALDTARYYENEEAIATFLSGFLLRFAEPNNARADPVWRSVRFRAKQRGGGPPRSRGGLRSPSTTRHPVGPVDVQHNGHVAHDLPVFVLTDIALLPQYVIADNVANV